MEERRRHDYIPQNAAQFNLFMTNLLAHVYARRLQWAVIPLTRLTELSDSYNDFKEAFDDTVGPHTSAQNLARRETQAACTRLLRAFVNQFLRFPPVTDVDRAEMGIPNHDTIRTDHTVVTEKVALTIEPGNIREVVVHFWIDGAAHRAKPDGYDGAVICSKAQSAFELGVCAMRKLHTNIPGVLRSKTPKLTGFAG